jgi:iron complex outermembrane receptor protein
MSSFPSIESVRRSTPSVRSRRLRHVGAVSVTALLAGAPALAQNADGAIPLDEITVSGEAGGLAAGPNLNAASTAGSRLGLTPLETPASVDVISGDVVRDRGQTSLEEAVTQNSAGLSFIGTPGNGGASFAARGFSGAGSVTVLYDGTRLYPGNGTVSFPFDTWTVDRIEVLRGPASVLYGEGAIGGAINVVPKKPLTETRRNEARVIVGTKETAGFAAGSAGPINDKFSYSFDAAGNRSDGWMDRGDSKNLALSGSLRWEPVDDFAFTLSYDSGFNRPSRYFGTPLKGAGKVEKDWIGKNFNVRDGEVSFDDTITQLKAEWTPFEGVAVKSVAYRVTSDREYRNAESYRWNPVHPENPTKGRIDRSSFIAITHEHEQIGARTDATFDHKLFGLDNQTVVGFDVNRIKFSRLNNAPYAGSDSLNPDDFDPGEFFSPSPFGRDYRATTNQYSLFIDDRLKLTDQISLVGGLRYDRPEIDYRNTRTGDASKSVRDSVSWRAGAVYEPIKGLALYAQYSEATDPVNSIISLNPAQQNLKLARGKQVEVGVKQSFWDDRVEWTLAAYHIEKTDLLVPDPLRPGVSLQVGKQSSRGLEASVGAELGHGWRIDADAAILDARYDEFSERVDGIEKPKSRKGNTPNAVPERLANFYATWNFAPNWRVSGGLQYVGRTFTSASNDHSRPDYLLVNAGLQWKPSDFATLDFRVKNLTDKTYAYAGGDHQWYFGAPRTAELSLHLRW